MLVAKQATHNPDPLSLSSKKKWRKKRKKGMQTAACMHRAADAPQLYTAKEAAAHRFKEL
jgi:hypothetical protein